MDGKTITANQRCHFYAKSKLALIHRRLWFHPLYHPAHLATTIPKMVGLKWLQATIRISVTSLLLLLLIPTPGVKQNIIANKRYVSYQQE